MYELRQRVPAHPVQKERDDPDRDPVSIHSFALGLQICNGRLHNTGPRSARIRTLKLCFVGKAFLHANTSCTLLRSMHGRFSSVLLQA